ncbi:MAG: hypothetical protein AVDCRST_MAG93-4509 [uncultured Chloroflexia bacterium]|uniref:Bacterial transcriptional activator domain-containing protein n=1 Tax=uncultured Chloroflexia bacterium TaxID=1672391 RepID=A0A6J4KA39_9CHLR|nr:MAG: hypothetical protein AVDCRST_MAG93-4509 [uncultured Chloroflexia bacterium]
MLYLLGHPFIELEEGKVSLQLSRPFMLLVYLACVDEWVERDHLAFFLRPDVDKETAQQYLRKLISNARKFSWARDLEVEAERLRWPIDTDVKRFRQARKDSRWYEAMTLYQGPLVGGADVPFWPSLDAWLQVEREALDYDWQDVTLQHARDLESLSRHREAASVAARLLAHDPFHEGALQCHITNLYFAGQREQALRAAHTFKARLKDELDFDLMPSTRELVDVIRSAGPLEKHSSPVRYGRRRDDLVSVPLADQAEELIALLESSGARLMSMTPAGDETVVIVAKRVSNTHALLRSVLRLALNLFREQHKARALELLLLVLSHPACDASLREEISRVWPDLKAFNPT